MSTPVLSVEKETSMRQVADLLRRYNIHGVPVVEMNRAGKERILGVVTDIEVCEYVLYIRMYACIYMCACVFIEIIYIESSLR